MIYTTLCYSSVTAQEESEACIVQYLKENGKLDNSFPSTPPTALCHISMPFSLSVVRSKNNDLIEKSFPNKASCLIKEFANKTSVDFQLKIGIIKNSNLTESDLKTQLVDARNEFKTSLEDIASQCGVNDTFISLFNSDLGIKTLKSDYCFAKYVVDEGLLPLINIDLNAYHIETKTVNCSSFIEEEARIHEENFSSRVYFYKECMLNAYKSGKIFDWYVAGIVLDNLEDQRVSKNVERKNVFKKFTKFSMAIASCSYNNGRYN